ncbi:unnamed protein product [Thlaspi arvense]|uniref:Reverse transcriptase zinc-binding domain-containing protein n=1 Tax=Thlaspi arvense TaxID=13288 RepID=A0AAU9SAT6_THLAR|nr:unnamed protein product [Thlaspi arvense]
MTRWSDNHHLETPCSGLYHLPIQIIHHLSYNHSRWTLILPYSSLCIEFTTDLWCELIQMQHSFSLDECPWVVSGDFNQIMHPSEHSDPMINHFTSDMLEMRESMRQLELFDLRYQCSPFTWSNRQPADPCAKKLDRLLVNNHWLARYPQSAAIFSAPDFSDHTPCHLNLATPLPLAGTKLFKFFNSLTTLPSFLPLIEASWTRAGTLLHQGVGLSALCAKQKILKRELLKLSKQTFSDIQKRVSETNENGNTCDLSLPSHPCSGCLTETYPWIKVKLGNGANTRFWIDNWCAMGSMSTFLASESSRQVGIPRDATLASLWRSGAWHLPPARSERQVSYQLQLSLLNLSPDTEDTYQWWIDDHAKNNYNTGSIYSAIIEQYPSVPWSRIIWFSQRIPKHSFLAWLVVLNRCPTRDRMRECGLQVDPLSVLCNSAAESRDHLFFDCPIHRSSFKPVHVLIRQIHQLIRNRASSLRPSNPPLASALLQMWFAGNKTSTSTLLVYGRSNFDVKYAIGDTQNILTQTLGVRGLHTSEFTLAKMIWDLENVQIPKGATTDRLFERIAAKLLELETKPTL